MFFKSSTYEIMLGVMKGGTACRSSHGQLTGPKDARKRTEGDGSDFEDKVTGFPLIQ